MNKELVTRAEKIKFLSDLSTGKTCIQDIRPQKIEFWTLRNGIYENEITQEVLCKEEYQLHKLQTKKKKVHIFFTELTND